MANPTIAAAWTIMGMGVGYFSIQRIMEPRPTPSIFVIDAFNNVRYQPLNKSRF
jgi:hypothetical protein